MPIAVTVPVSSASGMNSDGITTPEAGSRQRSSASTAATLPVARSNSGWYSRKNSSRSMAPRTRRSCSERCRESLFRSSE